MKCPQCFSADSKVVESRDVASGESIRRRRECENCEARFTTYERVERPNLVVVKKDGKREVFDRSKVLSGIAYASEKTSISGPKREDMVARIERKLYDLGKPEVGAGEIGELVMGELAAADEVAYVRFASVYRHFTSIKSFEESLSALKARKEASRSNYIGCCPVNGTRFHRWGVTKQVGTTSKLRNKKF